MSQEHPGPDYPATPTPWDQAPPASPEGAPGVTPDEPTQPLPPSFEAPAAEERTAVMPPYDPAVPPTAAPAGPPFPQVGYDAAASPGYLPFDEQAAHPTVADPRMFPPIQAYQEQPGVGYAPVPAAYPVPMAYGYPVDPNAPYGYDPATGLPYSDKSKLVAGLLQILVGSLGIGRFYLGDVGMGIAQLLVTLFTLGFGAIWGFIDGIVLLAGNPRDRFGRPLRP